MCGTATVLRSSLSGAQFKTSFENLYTVTRLSKLDPARLAFLPLVVAADDGVKLCFTEADLQAYPGMYFNYPGQGYSLRGIFAPYPKRTHDGGHDNLQNVVDEYDNFIAKAAPLTSFPWRTILIAREDRQLLDNDMVMAAGRTVASRRRVVDTPWIGSLGMVERLGTPRRRFRGRDQYADL